MMAIVWCPCPYLNPWASYIFSPSSVEAGKWEKKKAGGHLALCQVNQLIKSTHSFGNLINCRFYIPFFRIIVQDTWKKEEHFRPLILATPNTIGISMLHNINTGFKILYTAKTRFFPCLKLIIWLWVLFPKKKKKNY